MSLTFPVLWTAFTFGWIARGATRTFVRRRRAGHTIKDIVTKPVTGERPQVARVTEVS